LNSFINFQPAVEAFFYVHSSLEENKNAVAVPELAETQSEQPPPAEAASTQEAAPPVEEGPEAPAQVAIVPNIADAAESKLAETANLSPDMRKFLSFAGMCLFFPFPLIYSTFVKIFL
jgi:hypothetical protein